VQDEALEVDQAIVKLAGEVRVTEEVPSIVKESEAGE
jgi:hypothetical protein